MYSVSISFCLIMIFTALCELVNNLLKLMFAEVMFCVNYISDIYICVQYLYTYKLHKQVRNREHVRIYKSPF